MTWAYRAAAMLVSVARLVLHGKVLQSDPNSMQRCGINPDARRADLANGPWTNGASSMRYGVMEIIATAAGIGLSTVAEANSATITQMQNEYKVSDMTCQARRYSDQMCCGKCGLQWDVDDPDPPECQPQRTILSDRGIYDVTQAKTATKEQVVGRSVVARQKP